MTQSDQLVASLTLKRVITCSNKEISQPLVLVETIYEQTNLPYQPKVLNIIQYTPRRKEKELIIIENISFSGNVYFLPILQVNFPPKVHDPPSTQYDFSHPIRRPNSRLFPQPTQKTPSPLIPQYVHHHHLHRSRSFDFLYDSALFSLIIHFLDRWRS